MTVSSILLLAILTVLQIAHAPETITGTVIKAGTNIRQPLPNARLEISGPTSSLVVRSDDNGRFVFSNLAPGRYRLTVTRDGFIRQESPKPITLGGGQQSPEILFELEPAPGASGRVLDVYGQPVPNIMIQALRRTYDVRGNPRLAVAASALTDDRGDYRIFWLDPGEYFFHASSPPPENGRTPPPSAVAPTFYPGVNTADDATPLRLDTGEARVDFRLRGAALWTVNGQTMNGLTGRPADSVITLIPGAGDPNISQYRAESSAANRYPGEFSMEKVPPGPYLLVATSGSGNQAVRAIQRIELAPVPLAPSQEYGVSLTLSPPMVIAGRLFVESRTTADMLDARVALLSIDPEMPSPDNVPVRPDGQFLLNGVAPGSYVLEMSGLPQDLYLKAARFGDNDILETPLMLGTPADPKSLQVLLGSDGGHLQAAAYNGKNEIQPGALLVLVPDMARRSRRELYRLATSGDDGSAIFHGIPPGSYKLFAWERLQANAYLNADFLQTYENLGVPVKIASGDNEPVAVRLIPKN